MAGRLGLNELAPKVACGQYPAKAVVGEQITISATVFREGHERVGANVLWRGPASPATGDDQPGSEPLILLAREADWSSRFTATVVPDRLGLWTYTVQAWSDPLASWRSAIEAKVAAGQSAADLSNDLEIGARLLSRVVDRPGQRAVGAIEAAIGALRDTGRPLTERVRSALSVELWPILAADPLRELITSAEPGAIWVDRPLAAFGAWYEFFPRSCGSEVTEDGRPVRHGHFSDATGQLDRAAEMGFDIVYLPPIHPIGEVNRKGRNNSVDCEPGDVGSPWAIGSTAGGHDAVHPQLGTIDDFDHFVAAAGDRGLEVALDLAFNCAPDHPWVAQHPDWFTTLPDGTVAYAENPPKKYQDIYPLNFDNDPAGLYAELLRVVRFWISHKITIFRVDNPHTKPLDFWEWLIGQVRRTNPEVIFLAEAFTAPAMLHELARIGFSQSYTYFIWRTGKTEITEYGQELVQSANYLRPNFFVNTPDILHASLQQGGRPMFAIRAILAATLSPSWGMYSGYELYENQAAAAGSEEYADSEKYQLRPRDFDGALAHGRSLQPTISKLNAIRRAHPALRTLSGLHFHAITNDNLLCYSRRDLATGDTLIVVVCLDSRSQQWGQTDLSMAELGLKSDDIVDVVDELSGERYRWGRRNAVGLDPHWRPAHILRVDDKTSSAA
ncbi:MAG: alpha-1,4-glucan--maltose-1-phosphate maltosyltransferase [Nakamurella sp.]